MPNAEMSIEMKLIVHSMANAVLTLTFVTTLAATGCAVRYYDADHRDYHRWDGDEDRAYHDYWNQRHPREEYRDFNRLDGDQQRDYWNWRHGHPDASKGDSGHEGRGDDRNGGRGDDRDRH